MCYNISSYIFQLDGQQIKWTQLVNLVEQDLGMQRDITEDVGGLRLLPHIAVEHIYLTAPLRMKVKLAAQVSFICLF